MLAPTLGGSIFAWSITEGVDLVGFPFDLNLIFIIFGLAFYISNVLCALLPVSLDKQMKKND